MLCVIGTATRAPSCAHLSMSGTLTGKEVATESVFMPGG